MYFCLSLNQDFTVAEPCTNFSKTAQLSDSNAFDGTTGTYTLEKDSSCHKDSIDGKSIYSAILVAIFPDINYVTGSLTKVRFFAVPLK